MPVLIDKEKAEMWINLENKFYKVEQELTETKEMLNYYQVSDFVNKPSNNSVACISPFKPPTDLNLFDDNQ
jgi:putative SOS response-associated peptidase YedK